MAKRRVGILTAGGIAPCLSAAISCLIERYGKIDSETEIICYRHGYAGLLLGDSFTVSPGARRSIARLKAFGGSAIGNSRVKLSNGDDCRRRGLIGEGEDPQTVACKQLEKDDIAILHTIGGDDTSAVAAQLAKHLTENGHEIAVVGLPKTIDNDIAPITLTLGADSAAQESAAFFSHVVNECTTAPRMLIVHEVMGRNCGWLTATSAMDYRRWLDRQKFLPSMGLDRLRWEIHGVYIPELQWHMASEIERLRRTMDSVGNVNLFVSEGAGIETILKEMEVEGLEIPRDAFGHVKLDRINPGKWFGEQLAAHIGAEKTLVQKSGYFARSSAPNAKDLKLIADSANLAVECALAGKSGVVGLDERLNGALGLISFEHISGGKHYDPNAAEYRSLLGEIGQS
ncbi:MAG: pyrophosphate--fructose-6-phosphate 1-phosphotransferase [Puniceicoccales bacterium]|jgi:pyrophosphate--fructose-6-phosphate 1-phosphotransferase|nr:pyrophosphate--fructose-6-phosphate 1-phosphotransferase [Puniceicoccales bacterium]